MPLRLDIRKKFSQRSDRVKGVDLHPTEPWLLSALYNGNIYIWNTSDSTLVKSFEVSELPVRTAKFLPRKQWVIAGADDFLIRVYNYNTMDKVKVFEAHTDYIRSLAIHPTMPYLLSCSDDMLIKLWDWDKGWQCSQIFEGHSHYVMMVTFNPKDTNTFASASLDRTVKVWSIGQPAPNFTLEDHEKGVNCVDYFTGGDKPYLISGADDNLVKVWDYQTKACVQTLEGHTHNVAAACFHPELPIIVTGSEDGSVRVWNSQTYRQENELQYGMERVWAIAYIKGSNSVVVGYDEGCVMIKLGRDEPVASMDASGKIIWARHSEIQSVNIKSLGTEYSVADGERLPLPVKDLGSTELYPQSLCHNPNGRFVTVCGDGEFIVYTALAWRNKHFGSALEFVWSSDPGEFATRDKDRPGVTLHKNFKEAGVLDPGFAPDCIYGGPLLGLRSTDSISFYEWSDRSLVHSISVPGSIKDLYWSGSGEYVCIAGDTSFYLLRFDRAAVDEFIESGAEPDEDGVPDAFEIISETSERVRTGCWVGDCFIYNNSAWRLNYCVGGEISTMFHLDRPMFLLGYLAAQSRVYLIDKSYGIVSYALNLSMIEYKTLVLRGDMEAAAGVLASIPVDQLDGVARFLESRGYTREALDIARDPEYRFELAVGMGELDEAYAIATEVESKNKWKQLGDLALSAGRLGVAQEALSKAGDLAGLLMLHTSTGDAAGLEALIPLCQAVEKNNVTFVCLLLLGRVEECAQLLVSAGRFPEAAYLVRTYAPSHMSEMVKVWREDLKSVNPKAAESLADPAEYPNLFPKLDLAIEAEQHARQQSAQKRAAADFPSFEGSQLVDVMAQMEAMRLGPQGGESMEEDDAEEEFADAVPHHEAGGAAPLPADPQEAVMEAQDVGEGGAAVAEPPAAPGGGEVDLLGPIDDELTAGDPVPASSSIPETAPEADVAMEEEEVELEEEELVEEEEEEVEGAAPAPGAADGLDAAAEAFGGEDDGEDDGEVDDDWGLED